MRQPRSPQGEAYLVSILNWAIEAWLFSIGALRPTHFSALEAFDLILGDLT
jgi:hypothetical protein